MTYLYNGISYLTELEMLDAVIADHDPRDLPVRDSTIAAYQRCRGVTRLRIARSIIQAMHSADRRETVAANGM